MENKKLVEEILKAIIKETTKKQGYLRRHKRILPMIGFDMKRADYAFYLIFDRIQLNMILTKCQMGRKLCLWGESCYDYGWLQIKTFSYKKYEKTCFSALLEKPITGDLST